MGFPRFSVTVVLLLGTVISMGCGNKKKTKTPDPVKMATLKSEVKGKWDESEALGKELNQSFHILILDEDYRTRNGSLVTSKLMGQKFNWGRLTLAERHAAKEKLARYVTVVGRLIEIDAKRGVYITNMDKVRSRYEGSLAFQESLNMFEKVVGEQYEPKTPGQSPIYFAPIDI